MTVHKVIVLYFIFSFVASTLSAQTNITAKAAPNAIGSAGNVATVSGAVYAWTVGETVIFTGAYAEGFSTQGFHQPMICKTIPVILATNQTSCFDPYTLSVAQGFSKYQWRIGNNIIANARSADYYPVRNGDYTVFVGDSTGCMITTTPVSVDLSAKNITPSILVYGATVAADTLLEASSAASYQWFVILPDGSHKYILGANAQTYKPLFRATYYVKINTADNCIAYSAPYVLNNNAMDLLNRYSFDQTDSSINLRSLKIIYEHKLAIYPIPTKDLFHIDFESPARNMVTFSLYNVLGVPVSVRTMNNSNGRLQLKYERGDLPAGKYLFSIADGDKKMTQNIIFE